MGYILFELNYGYHPWVSFENKWDVYLRFFLANKLAIKLRKLIYIYCQIFLYVLDSQKQAQDKESKLETMYSIKRSSLIANISGQSEIKNLKPNFLGFFKCYIYLESKLTR